MVGSLGGDDIAPVLGKSLDDQWWHIRYDGKLGWVSAEFAQPVDTQPAGAPDAVVEAEQPLPAEVTVRRGDLVNVRNGPGVGFGILGRMAGGQRASILGKSDDDQWWQIDYEGQSGWISARYVKAMGDVASVPTVAQP